MQHLHQIIVKFPKLKLSREYRVASLDVAWWLEQHTLAMMKYIHQTAATLGKSSAQSEVRRMIALCLPGQVHQSCMDRLSRECAVA